MASAGDAGMGGGDLGPGSYEVGRGEVRSEEGGTAPVTVASARGGVRLVFHVLAVAVGVGVVAWVLLGADRVGWTRILGCVTFGLFWLGLLLFGGYRLSGRDGFRVGPAEAPWLRLRYGVRTARWTVEVEGRGVATVAFPPLLDLRWTLLDAEGEVVARTSRPAFREDGAAELDLETPGGEVVGSYVLPGGEEVVRVRIGEGPVEPVLLVALGLAMLAGG